MNKLFALVITTLLVSACGGGSSSSGGVPLAMNDTTDAGATTDAGNNSNPDGATTSANDGASNDGTTTSTDDSTSTAGSTTTGTESETTAGSTTAGTEPLDTEGTTTSTNDPVTVEPPVVPFDKTVSFLMGDQVAAGIDEALPLASDNPARPENYSAPNTIQLVGDTTAQVELAYNVQAPLRTLYIGQLNAREHITFNLQSDEPLNSNQQSVVFVVTLPSNNETRCYEIVVSDINELVSEPHSICIEAIESEEGKDPRKVYFADFSGQSTLSSVALDTGVVSIIGDTGVSLTDIAFLGLNLYGITFGQLVEIDVETGATTLVGDHGYSGANALEGHNGVLYAGDTAGNIMTIDPETAQATVIGSYPDNAYSSGDLVISPDSDDRLIGTAKAPGFDTDVLVSIDILSGESRLIGEIGFTNVWGLAFFRDQLVGLTNDGEFILIDVKTGRSALVSKDAALSSGGATVDQLDFCDAPRYAGYLNRRTATCEDRWKADFWLKVLSPLHYDNIAFSKEWMSGVDDVNEAARMKIEIVRLTMDVFNTAATINHARLRATGARSLAQVQSDQIELMSELVNKQRDFITTLYGSEAAAIWSRQVGLLIEAIPTGTPNPFSLSVAAATEIAEAAVNAISIAQFNDIERNLNNITIAGFLLHNYVAESTNRNSLAKRLGVDFTGDMVPVVVAAAKKQNIAYLDFGLLGLDTNYRVQEVIAIFERNAGYLDSWSAKLAD